MARDEKRRYEARLMRNGEEIEVLEGTPAEIATHFGLTAEREQGAIAQVCEWADEEVCAQGYAIGSVESIVIEPSEEEEF